MAIRKIGTIVECFIFLLLLACLAGLLFAPKMATFLSPVFGEFHFWQAIVFLYLSLVAAIWLLIELLLIMRTVRKGNPFLSSTVAGLWRIAASCLLAFLAFLLKVICRFSFLSLVCGIILLFGALCAAVLACVFQQAVHYKEENDLTI